MGSKEGRKRVDNGTLDNIHDKSMLLKEELVLSTYAIACISSSPIV